MLITCYSSIHNDLEETIHLSMGASLVAQMVKNLLAMQETRVQSLNQGDTLQKGMATHCSFLAVLNPMDRGAWWATVHGVAKSWTCLSN